MNKRKAIIAGMVAACLGIAAWAFGLFGGDPAVAKLHDLGSQMRDSNLTAAQREQLRGDFRQQIQSLTDAQRHAFFDSSRGERENRATQRMNEFFALSKAEQAKRLDEIIDRMLKGTGGQNAANRNGSGNRAGMTDAQREQRSKQRIENSNPNTRAQASQFRRMLDQRVQQRGITLPPGRGFGLRGA